MTPNPDKFKQIKEHGAKSILMGVARSADGRLFAGGSDFKVYAVTADATKAEFKELYGHESYVTSMAVAGETLVSGGYDGRLTWFDTKAGKVIESVEAHSKWIRRVVASNNGKRVASVGDDMVLRIFDATTRKKLHELKGHAEKTPHNFQSMLYALAWSADGKRIATGDKVGKIIVWNSESGEKEIELEAPVMYTWEPAARLHSIGGLRSLTFSADGKLLAAGGMGKVGNIDHLEGKARVEVFDLSEKKRVIEFPGDKFNGLTNRLIFSPDGGLLIGAGGAGDGFFQIYDIKAKKVARQEKASFHIHDVVVDEKAETFVAVGHNKIAIYELKA
jgi:WD40 repeat protein